MKNLIIILLAILCGQSFAHTGQINPENIKVWTNVSKSQTCVGSFYYHKDGFIFIETVYGEIVKFKETELTPELKKFAQSKIGEIQQINRQIQLKHLKNTVSERTNLTKTPSIFGLGALLIFLLFFCYLLKMKHPILVPVLGILLVASIYSFGNGHVLKRGLSTRPTFMDSAFSYFKPTINTRWDNQYFYVESNGIADHEMMIGITAWQQQVPIPQCYIGTNAWSIPLNPVVANTPVPVNNQHFLRGAVAVAVNGIAIFNPYTNTGVDAFLDGQLDQYGGHSGRADDYHYHIAPTVLYNKIPKTSPIAFALDGFAIYGDLEPDGTAMKALDVNHGHYETGGLYHYHSSSSAPYMIGNMVGKVTEDSTLQIIPQATAKGVRPALTPLKGATITHCHKYSTGLGYILTYTIGSQKDTVDYSWTSLGKYTYQFKVNGTTTTNNYNGQKPCAVPQTSNTESISNVEFEVYPNPTNTLLNLKFPTSVGIVKSLQIFNLSGQLIQKIIGKKDVLDLSSLKAGIYYLHLETDQSKLSTKFIIR